MNSQGDARRVRVLGPATAACLNFPITKNRRTQRCPCCPSKTDIYLRCHSPSARPLVPPQSGEISPLSVVANALWLLSLFTSIVNCPSVHGCGC
jgi:hypothetical protein